MIIVLLCAMVGLQLEVAKRIIKAMQVAEATEMPAGRQLRAGAEKK